MPLLSPNLDDRTWHDLMLEATARIRLTCPEWTDLSPHDPGMVLVEAFAHLTETMLYRLNRLPEKVYVELLRLIGVQLQPPAAATVELVFRLDRSRTATVEIPRGTRVATQRGEGGGPVIFVTGEAARIEPGRQEVSVLAYHAEPVEAEVLGTSTGQPGQSFRLKRPPVVARVKNALEVIVGVEAAPGELAERAPAREHGGKSYRIWTEVPGFADTSEDPHVFRIDRVAGLVSFAPAARMLEGGELAPSPEPLAGAPPVGRLILAWYFTGGGTDGNVLENTLKVLKDPVPGATLEVTNPKPAGGGRAVETLENALVRGPEDMHLLRRAITARDYETLALRSASGIARARAFTQASLWSHAAPGTVEVLLVPDLPASLRGPDDRGVTAQALIAHQTEAARQRIQDELDDRKPVVSSVDVGWTGYKTVAVHAKVVVHRAEDAVATRARIESRLYRTLSPLPQAGSLPGAEQGRGWRFGRALRQSSVFDVILAEPGVVFADDVRLVVERVPEAVKALAADPFRPRPIYAGAGIHVFRSLDQGDGWEPVGMFEGEDVDCIETHPQRPGLMAVASRLVGNPRQSRVRVSFDAGESWDPSTQTLNDAVVEDMAWTMREGAPVLLLATGAGLLELSMQRGARPLPVIIDRGTPSLGIYAVAASTDFRGSSSVAVAAMQGRGVFLSITGGRGDSFRSLGLKNDDVRVLEMQHDGPRTFLWAGMYAASGTETGTGCAAIELLGTADAPGGWRRYDRNWAGGSCLAIAFSGATVYAGTHRAGVLFCDSSKEDVSWRRPDPGSGLPTRTEERLFHPVAALATTGGEGLVFAGGPAGLYRTRDGERYEPCSQREFSDKVTIPPTWLFCSGQHQIEVVHDATFRD